MLKRLLEVARTRTARALVTIGCLGALVAVVDFGGVFDRLASARPAYLAAATGVAVADRVVMVGKWLPLLKPLVPQISIMKAARAYVASGIGLYLLPMSIGADILRASALGVGSEQLTEVSVTIVVERTLGLAAMGLVCIGSLFLALRFDVDLTLLIPWAVLVVVVGLGILIAPASDRLRHILEALTSRFGSEAGMARLKRVTEAFRAYRGEEATIGIVAVLTVVEQLIPAGTMWFAAQALGLDIPLLVMLVVVPLALFVARLPISLGGVGVAEGAMVYLFGLFGLGVADALALALLGRLIDVAVVAVPGAILWHELVPGEPDSASVKQ